MAATIPFSLIRNSSALISPRLFVPFVKAANHNFSKFILPIQSRSIQDFVFFFFFFKHSEQPEPVSGAKYCMLDFKRTVIRLPFSTGATNNEQAAAKAAALDADSGAPTIFDKIINKEIPSSIVYEDEKVLAFRDINPQAPVHVLVIPKFRDGLTQLGKADPRHEEILGQLLYAAKIVAEKEGIVDGFRVVINNGPSACQSVYHLHLHVLGGRQMKWPPG